jgi:arylsulfatase A-like enzyme
MEDRQVMISRRSFLGMLAANAGAGLYSSIAAFGKGIEYGGKKPNVLFIAIDDLNDYLSLLRGYPGLKTPNIERFAQTAVTFSRAYCAAPICNPSRTAIMSGVAPWRTGVYENADAWQKSKPAMDAVIMPEHFKANGYTTMWSGKIFHTRPGAARMEAMFDDDLNKDGGQPPNAKVKVIPDYIKRPNLFNYEAWTGPDEDFPDVRNAKVTVERLGKKHKKPFFLQHGIYRPHNPWTAPKRFFDMYPLDKIQMPPLLENDLDDIPEQGKSRAIDPVSFEEIRKTGHWRPLVRAYLACITFMDETLGKIIDALDNGPNKDNTIVCVWADHGFHMGEKKHFAKYALWELTTHTALWFRVPGVSQGGSVCKRTVNLLDLYPTLVDLCGLPNLDEQLDGVSIRKLIEKPRFKWERPSVTTHRYNCHAARDEQWRYIRYADGSEELYDHERDINEWHNLADKSEYAEVKAKLAKWLPKTNAPAVGKGPISGKTPVKSAPGKKKAKKKK